MNDFEISVTNECNWNCKYCLVDTHKQGVKPFSLVQDEISSLPNDCSITLSGGEPGMLSRDEVEWIIKKTKSKGIIVDLVTNGLFLKKHKDFMSDISEILYHCIQDLETDDEIIKYDYKDLHYAIVLDKIDNIKYVEKIFKKYPDIKFLISPNIKSKEIIDIKKFLRFISKHKNNIEYDRTKDEFIKNISKF